MIAAIGARELAITSSHALTAADLPAFHRDPFDRILIAQAIVEGLVLVTADEAVREYSVPVQWAL
jgi:PIN domain nuclease of toxin-antitoxin system